MFTLAIEVVFSTLLVYPLKWHTQEDAEHYKLQSPPLSSFRVMSENEIIGWEGRIIKIPIKWRTS